MNLTTTHRSLRTGVLAALLAALLLAAFAVSPATPGSDAKPARTAAAKSGVLKGWPSKMRLATEFLRLLEAKDQAGLRRFLDPAFLLQRGDGSYLTKSEYLKDPALVDDFQVRGIVATHNGDVRVVRFEAKTDQTIDGTKVPGVWIPRLSTFKRTKGVWRLIAHANFLPPTR